MRQAQKVKNKIKSQWKIDFKKIYTEIVYFGIIVIENRWVV